MGVIHENFFHPDLLIYIMVVPHDCVMKYTDTGIP